MSLGYVRIYKATATTTAKTCHLCGKEKSEMWVLKISPRNALKKNIGASHVKNHERYTSHYVGICTDCVENEDEILHVVSEYLDEVRVLSSNGRIRKRVKTNSNSVCVSTPNSVCVSTPASSARVKARKLSELLSEGGRVATMSGRRWGRQRQQDEI